MKDGYLFIILSIIVLFFFACTRRKNDDMTHLVKEWEKKEIIFPNNLYFTLYGKDTVQYPAHLQYTILSYEVRNMHSMNICRLRSNWAFLWRYVYWLWSCCVCIGESVKDVMVSVGLFFL